MDHKKDALVIGKGMVFDQSKQMLAEYFNFVQVISREDADFDCILMKYVYGGGL